MRGSALSRRDEASASPVRLAEASTDALVLHWFDTDETPRLIVDAALAIKWLNLAADRELQRRRDIARHGDRLAAIHPEHQADLLDFLGRCRAETGTLCLRSTDGGGHLLVRAQPLPAGRYGLILRRSDETFRPDYPDFGAAFQLTPAEVRVLLQLADGYSAAGAAERLGIGTETVRTHIKNLYAKLHVGSREGLLSRIRAYQL